MMKGGFNPGNMQNLMRQAQKMQEQLQADMANAEKELEQTIVTATSGGGVVKVEMTGSKKLVSIKIDPQAVDADDVEMLEDLIISGVNEALQKASELEQQLKPQVPGGLF